MELAIKGMAALLLTVMVFFIGKYVRAKQIAGENKVLADYMASLDMLCEEMKRKLETTRKYRHDLAGYIQTLEALLRESKQSEFLDSIIKMKQEECAKHGLVLEAKVESGDYSGMEAIDKVCLFINLLDNAIEATERLPENARTNILLYVRICDGKLCISVENAASEEETFSFRTKKTDAENHGLGTAIIKQVLEKYQGTRNLQMDKEALLIKDEITLVLEAQ